MSTPRVTSYRTSDRLEWELTEDREVIQLKAASGDIDFQYRHIETPKFPVFVEAAEKSGIGPLRWTTVGTASEAAFYTNQTREGEVGDFLRKHEGPPGHVHRPQSRLHQRDQLPGAG